MIFKKSERFRRIGRDIYIYVRGDCGSYCEVGVYLSGVKALRAKHHILFTLSFFYKN